MSINLSDCLYFFKTQAFEKEYSIAPKYFKKIV